MMKNKRTYRKAARIAMISLAVIVGIVLLAQFFTWGDKYDRTVAQRQKECWKEIYLIIEASHVKKADWIKQTVSNQSSGFGGVDYCGTLELIKNGQDQ